MREFSLHPRCEAGADVAKRLDLKDVNIYYGSFRAVADVSLSVLPRSVTAFIGPSGCGKTTVLRILNRMHEVIPGARMEGSVLLDDDDIYGSGVDPVGVRRAIGMVFQRPNPFPTMSIRDNVVAGLKLQGVRNRKLLSDTAEYALRGANLWDEVKDRLDRPGGGLSGGQQQRLCIARAIAVQPDVLLMDREWGHGVATAVDVTLLGRFYERFADHAVEVARRVIFQATGALPDDEKR